MDKDLLAFLNRETNAVKLTLTISRETLDNTHEHICISHDDLTEYLFTFWRVMKSDKPKPERKHTGGKKPYIMVMVEKIRALQKENSDLNLENILGSAVMLADNIEWNTGLLVNKRKKTPLSFADLRKIYGCSNDKLARKIKEMESVGVLLKDKEGYKISPFFIRKGGKK